MFTVPFAYHHSLYVIIPDLLEQEGSLRGQTTQECALIGQGQYIEHQWCCRQIMQRCILFQGTPQGCEWFATLCQISIHMFMSKRLYHHGTLESEPMVFGCCFVFGSTRTDDQGGHMIMVVGVN